MFILLFHELNPVIIVVDFTSTAWSHRNLHYLQQRVSERLVCLAVWQIICKYRLWIRVRSQILLRSKFISRV